MIIDDDLSLINEGVWKQWGDTRFKIAHISNMKFQRALSRLQQPHRKKLENGTIDPKVNRDIVCQAMAEGVVIDWDGVKDKAGNTVPYSVDMAFKALSRDPDMRDFVSDIASNMAHYRSIALEDLGNG